MMNVTPGLLFFGGYHPQTSEINSFRNSLLLLTELGSDKSGFTWSGLRYLKPCLELRKTQRDAVRHTTDTILGGETRCQRGRVDDFCTWSPRKGDGWHGMETAGIHVAEIGWTSTQARPNCWLKNGWNGMHRSVPSIMMDNDGTVGQTWPFKTCLILKCAAKVKW